MKFIRALWGDPKYFAKEIPKPSLFDEILVGMVNDMPGLNYEFLSKLNEDEWKNDFFNFITVQSQNLKKNII